MPRYLPLALASALAACAPSQSHLATPSLPDELAASRTFADGTGEWPRDQWWRAYGDPQLDSLIEEARAASPDVARAMARVRQAEALARQVSATLLPSVTADGSAGLVKQSYNNGIPAAFVPRGWNTSGTLTAGAQFDPDLWGRNRAALAAARSEAEAAAVDAEQARLLLSTEIAAAYADLARLEAEGAIAARAVEIRGSTLDLIQQRVSSGLDNRGTEELARSRAAGARAELAATKEAIALTRNRIAALVGEGPDRALDIQPPQITDILPREVPERLALDLVGRRPDIVSARLRAEAAVSRIRGARAAFYPNINIAALFGLQSLGLSNLVDSGSTVGSVGPALSLPLFNREALVGSLRSTEAQSDIAVADYDATLIGALREVADAATSLEALQTRRAEAGEALEAAEQAYDIARQRYDGGLATYLDVLTAEDTVLDRRRIATELDARAFTLDVALVRALGGGFSDSSLSSRSAQGDRDG